MWNWLNSSAMLDQAIHSAILRYRCRCLSTGSLWSLEAARIAAWQESCGADFTSDVPKGAKSKTGKCMKMQYFEVFGPLHHDGQSLSHSVGAFRVFAVLCCIFWSNACTRWSVVAPTLSACTRLQILGNRLCLSLIWNNILHHIATTCQFNSQVWQVVKWSQAYKLATLVHPRFTFKAHRHPSKASEASRALIVGAGARLTRATWPQGSVCPSGPC